MTDRNAGETNIGVVPEGPSVIPFINPAGYDAIQDLTGYHHGEYHDQ